ncbi:beta strand repeat-containing protein, partial [Thiorhodococcus fuscus]
REALIAKTGAAEEFTSHLDTVEENNAYAADPSDAVDWLAGVTDADSAAAASGAIDGVIQGIVDGEVSPGQTFTLTTGQDVSGVLIGSDGTTSTDGNDTFNAAPYNLLGDYANTLQSFDALDGGKGDDVLNIFVGSSGENASQVGTVQNIETINIYNTEAADDLTYFFGGSGGFDASKFVGAQEIWQIDGATSVDKVASDNTLGFRNLDIVGSADVGLTINMAAGETTLNAVLDNATTIDDGSGGQSGSVAVDINGANTINVSGDFTYESETACGNPVTLDAYAKLAASVASGDTLTLNTEVDVMLVPTEGVGGSGGFSFEVLDASASDADIFLMKTAATSGSGAIHTIITGAGNDEIGGSGGVISNATAAQGVTLATNGGDDTVELDNDGSGTTSIDLGEGDNTLTISGTSKTLEITAGAGADTLTFEGSGGTGFQDMGTVETTSVDVNLGAGDDSVTFDDFGMSDLGATWVIDGGEGDNDVTLNVDADQVFQPTDYTALTERLVNFNELTLVDQGASGSGQTYIVDADRMTGYERFGFDDNATSGGGDYRILNVEDQVITLDGHADGSGSGVSSTVTVVDAGFEAASGTTDLTQAEIADGGSDSYDSVTSYGGTVSVGVKGGDAYDPATVVAYANALNLEVAVNGYATADGDFKTLDVALNSTILYDSVCPDADETGVVGSNFAFRAPGMSMTGSSNSTQTNDVSVAELTTLTLTGTGTAEVVGGGKLATIDASGLTAIAWDATDKKVVAGSGLTFATQNAALAETIKLSGGLDSVTYDEIGSGSGDFGSTVFKTDVIEGFTLVEDADAEGTVDKTLSDSFVLGGDYSVTELTSKQKSDIASLSLGNKLDYLAQLDATDDALYIFGDSGNTYIFGDLVNGTNGVVDDTDLLVKFAGGVDEELLASLLTVPTVAVDGVGNLAKYDLEDTAANLAGANATVLDGARNITASTDATVSEAGTIVDATNSGSMEYDVSDTLSNLLGVAADGTTPGSDELASSKIASTITITAELTANDEEVTFTGLTSETATPASDASAIDFVDNEATLSQTELAAISTASITLTDADVITVNSVIMSGGDFSEAAAIDLLNNNDVISFSGGSAAINAANYKDVFNTQGVAATSTDTISVTADGTSTLIATDAIDVFTLVAADASNFDSIAGLSTSDKLNVLAADGSTAGSYLAGPAATGVNVVGDVDTAGEWYFAGDTLTYWNAAANAGAGAAVSIELTGVATVSASNQGVFSITGLDGV